jgi:hypothetical protein
MRNRKKWFEPKNEPEREEMKGNESHITIPGAYVFVNLLK